MTKTQRAIIASKINADQIRITRSGEVHAKGIMPNSNVYGWFFAGWADELLTRASCAHHD